MNNRRGQMKTRNGLIAVLDVGSTKVCCLIARAPAGKGANIVGIGHQVSNGIRTGAIVDMEAAAASIRSTVETAEKMAGENISQVIVNLSAGEPESRLIAYDISIAGHQVGDADLRRILDPSTISKENLGNRELVHSIAVGYSIDGCRGVRDPRGMYGERLGVNLHTVSASGGAVRNLVTCISRCHLGVEGKVVSPYASALACLVEDEKKLGVTCIDMGGGTTSIAVFFDGELVHIDTLPIGGVHVTNDIARGLSTPLAHAERMKTLYGSVIPSPSDEYELITVPPIGEKMSANSSQVPRSMLIGIIRPRLEETFEMVRARLQDAGFDKAAGRRVVLTGGAAQLPGAGDLAAMILDKQVRIGRPKPMEGLTDAVGGPAFATTAGLLVYALNDLADAPEGVYRPTEEPNGHFGRLGQWIRENF